MFTATRWTYNKSPSTACPQNSFCVQNRVTLLNVKCFVCNQNILFISNSFIYHEESVQYGICLVVMLYLFVGTFLYFSKSIWIKLEVNVHSRIIFLRNEIYCLHQLYIKWLYHQLKCVSSSNTINNTFIRESICCK